MKLRLTIDVEYSGGALVQDLHPLLLEAADHLADEGMLSGTTAAWVESWSAKVEEIEVSK
jgi:hypothetical protein